MSDIRKVYGGIYIDKSVTIETAEEFGVYLGKDQTTWFGKDSEVFSFTECVDVGGMYNLQYIDGYSFGINKHDKTWHVRDTGFKGCKHVIFKGTYADEDFEREVEDYIHQMTGSGKSFQRPKPKEKEEKPIIVKPQLELSLYLQ